MPITDAGSSPHHASPAIADTGRLRRTAIILRVASEAVLRLLDARGLATSQEQRQLVTASIDPAQLDLWFDRAITASTAEDVFTGPR